MMSNPLWRGCLLAVLCCAVSAPNAAVAGQRFASSVGAVPLVELYTSEGCSSCPPADRWMSGLRDDPGLWKRLVPVAFHVDYWDDIGWTDRFASPFHGLRQRRYAAAGRLSQVYTPGVLAGGREWTGWADREPLPFVPDRAPGILAVEMVDSVRARVEFRPAGAAAARIDAVVSLLGFGLESTIRAGENAGRHLRHDFVVLGMVEVPLRRDGQALTAEVVLPPLSQPAPRLALAAWVSADGNPAPLQAVGGWLDSH